MVRDAYSASSQLQPADGGAAVQPLDLRGGNANLTQELSQLLAASIAQGQAGKRAPGAAAAGSELANLAALVSASQGQRNLQPSYRDGLSSLSYIRPVQHPAPPPPPAPVPAPAPAAGGLLVAEPHDEEPMPIPSTWRQPMSSDDERWYRQQLGAAGLGLIAGLIVVVPAVLWLSGWLGGPQAKAVARSQPAPDSAPVRVAEVKPVPVKVHVAASVEPRIAAPMAAAAPAEPVVPAGRRSVPERAVVAALPPPPKVEPVRSRADELLAQAKRRIESGDIVGARDILQSSQVQTSAPMTFMLAETYDPNMLASWQTRGIVANPERARALYQKARDLGDSRAQKRIDWLTGN